MSTDSSEDLSDARQGQDLSSSNHPKQIGVYKILRLLGEGGMGLVYEAEQTETIRRRVALKLLRPGFGTEEVVARFEAERQALAVMDHSGIAKVLEAGVADDGRPYFVMELVRGHSIQDYCDAGQLSLDQRLDLMIQVCQAVQHAHQKGVIHRDLKPSNVLVSEQDGVPQVKVIDFGLAKALGHRLTERTLVTQFGQAMGTPAYMSPEQAEMSGLDVDTRTDIYSLGVMLYELLIGRLPVDPGQVGYAAFIARLMLRDTDAPSLRSRFSDLEPSYRTAIATFRRTTPTNLQKEIGGDVGAIVMKTIEKDRNRRYETANALALDLQRHLNHEPVAARPPNARYRLGKFVRRNRPAVVAAAVAALAVLTGAILTTVGFVRATRAEAVAGDARVRAEQEAATANQVSEFLIGLFKVSDPSESRGNQVTAREILDRGAQRIEEELVDQPVVQSRLLFTMAQVYRTLGLHQEALRLAEQSLQQRRSIFREVSLPVASGLSELGLTHLNLGHFDEATAYMEEALAIYDTIVGPTDARVGRTLTNLASIYVQQAKYDEAVPLFERALIIKVDSFGPDHPQTARTLYNMALMHRRLKHYDSSATLYRRTLDIRVKAFGLDDPSVSRTLNGLANVYVNLEQFDSAEVLFRRSLEQKERNLGPDHPQVANSVNNLAIVFARQGDLEKALPYFERALRIREEAYGPDHPRVAANLNNLGLVYRDLDRYQEAEAAFQRSLAIAEKALGPQHPRVAETLDNYAELLREMGRPEEADLLTQRADEIESGGG